MMLRKAKGVLFDLFGTLIDVDQARLPALRINGNIVPSTLPVLSQEIAEAYDDIGIERILIELILTLKDREHRNADDYAELPAWSIFARVLERLGIPQDDASMELATHLSDVQMRVTANAVYALPGARKVLEHLRHRELRTALVSNLDNVSSVPWLLEAAGLSSLFDTIVLSGDVGVCKPHEKIFLKALADLNFSAADVVHVGDEAIPDIWGAGRMGMQAVWLNSTNIPYPQDRYEPALTLVSLEELLCYFP